MQQMYLRTGWDGKYFGKSCLFFISFVALVLISNKGRTHIHVNKPRMLKKPLLIRRSAFPFALSGGMLYSVVSSVVGTLQVHFDNFS